MTEWFMNKLHDTSKEMGIDFEITKYGLKVETAFWIDVLISLTLCACLHKLSEGILFILAFTFLRSYCGGYHCKTYIHCGVSTVFMVISSSLIGRIVFFHSPFCLMIPFIYLFVNSPVQNENQVLNTTEVKIYHQYAQRRLIMLTILFFILKNSKLNVQASMIPLAMIWLMLLCMIQTVKKRKETKNEFDISMDCKDVQDIR